MLTAGGEDVFKGRYTDGTKIDVTAGSLVDLRFGINVSLRPTLDLQTSLGFHTDATNGTNGNATFTRFPL